MGLKFSLWIRIRTEQHLGYPRYCLRMSRLSLHLPRVIYNAIYSIYFESTIFVELGIMVFCPVYYLCFHNKHMLYSILIFILEKDDTSRERNRFIQGFSDGEEECQNVTELAELGRPLGEKILKYWMDKISRKLTNSQVVFSSYFSLKLIN